jgi:hypothetical protein
VFCILSPIINFRTRLSHIDITPDIVIRRATEKEIQMIDNINDYHASSQKGKWKYLMICKEAAGAGEGEAEEDVEEASMSDIFKTLRLLKANYIGPGNRYYLQNNRLVSYIPEPISEDSINACEGIKYELRRDEISSLIKLYNKVSKLDHDKNVRIDEAIMRFYNSCEMGRMYVPIDIFVGLEALYLRDDKELSYKLALRAAFLLGETYEKRSHIFNTIKKAYTIRSGSVHGNDIEFTIKTREKFNEYINTIYDSREILRESIIRFLDLLEINSHDKYVKNILDDNILRSSPNLH